MDPETKQRLKNLSKQARKLRRKYRNSEEYRAVYDEVQGALRRRALEIVAETKGVTT